MGGPSKVSESALDPNGLLVQALGAPVYGDSVTILSGQNLAAGALLGQITSGGKYKASLTASSDGSEVPSAILAEDCDASGGDKTAFVYYNGEFNSAKVVFGSAHTVASTKKALAARGIFLHTPQPA